MINLFKSNKNKLFIISIILSFFSKSNLLEIILDGHNPIQFFYPHSNQITRIDVRFHFMENSQGLNYRQYIGIAFPNALAKELSFDKGLNPKYSCSLIELNSKQSFIMNAEKSTISEPNYLYCKLDDRINYIVKVGTKNNYKLTIEFNSIRISSLNYIKNFLIFTSTSNNINKIIIDQSIHFGTIIIYPNWEENKIPSFEIIDQAKLLSNTPVKDLLPYQIVDISLTMKSNIFISFSEVILMIRFPDDLISQAKTVDSTGDNINPALKGTLKIIPFSNNYLIIDGIEDDFNPGKIFTIILKGIITQDKLVNVSKPLELFVFYKNTYSVLSYSKTPIDFLKVNSVKLKLTSNHPENWDIWRNALWPMNFIITNDVTELKNGGFIMLQHSNAINNEIKWNFIASTCDFSESGNFDNNFGKRPNCYPLRTDFEYSSNDVYSGSAIFFKLNNIKVGQIINLTVWGSADNCGGNKSENLSSSLKPDFAYRQFNFKAYIYSNINQYETNENRFIGNNINLLGYSDEITMGNKCFNNIINGFENFDGKELVSASEGGARVFSKERFLKKNINFHSSSNNAKKDINLFREFYNWEISIESSANTSCTNCHLLNISLNSIKYESAFIYGNKSVTNQNSYFSLRLPIIHYIKDSDRKNKNIGIPAEYLPVNFAYSDNNIEQVPGSFPGRLKFLFSKNWFNLGELNSCYISWGMHSPDVKDLNKDKILIVDDTIGETNSNHNWITSNRGNSNAWIDNTNTCLAKNVNPNCKSINILSKHHTGNIQTNNQFNNFKDISTILYHETKNVLTFYLYYFSNCLKWVQTPSIKSVYTYIDFQAQWLYSDDGSKIGSPSRNLRMIKLFPEAGVFNDNTATSPLFLSITTPPLRPSQMTDKTYYLHYALGSGSNLTGICLIEISGKSVTDIITSTTTHIGIWIGFGVILETDYNDISSIYPITPLNISNNIPYAFQSANFLNIKESMLYGNENDDNSSNTSIFRSMLINYMKTGVTGFPTNYDVNSRDAPNHVNNIYNNSSSYYFLMGSLILISQKKDVSMINSIQKETQQRNLLIPIYCPIKNDKIYFGNGIPSLYITSIKMSAYNDITSIEKIMSVNINDKPTNDTNSLYSVIISSVYSSTSNIDLYRSSINQTTPNSINSNSLNFKKNLITIRWAPYTTNQENFANYIYLYLGSKDINTPNLGKCTSHVLLLNESIEVDRDKLNTSFVGYINYFPKINKFYFLGKEFSHSIYVGLQDNNYPTNDNITLGSGKFNVETADMYFVGVKRPLIDFYYSKGSFSQAYDKIGYFCADLKSKENYTNFLYNADLTTKIFLVDYNLTSKDPKTLAIKIGADKSDMVYKNDVGGNIKIESTSSVLTGIPAGSTINFSFLGTVINSSSICGLADKNNIATDCEYSNNIVSCLIPKAMNTLTICCYNISYLGSVTTDTIILNDLNVTVPAYPLSFSEYYTDKILIEENPTTSTWETSHLLKNDIISFIPATITTIKYTHVLQDSGIGKVNFTITLPRELTRNMAITIYADLSAYYIPNSSPKCKVAFGYGLGFTPENSDDILIDNCNVSNLGSSINAIKITTKNLIYKCGLSFSKVLDIFVWPVLTINLKTSPYNSLNFRVIMNLNNEYSDALAFNSSSFTINDTQVYCEKPLLMNQWDNLCPLVSIDPRIPGEYGDYLFEIDIDSYGKYLKNTIPNELTIFFPINYFGSDFNNIFCYNLIKNINLNCVFDDNGILNIRLPTYLQIGTGKKLQIKITGILNPSIESNISVYFPCTLNKTDFTNDSRINLITGSGKYSDGIDLPSSIGKIGNLRYLYVPIPIVDTNPRSTSTITFKVGFDTIGGMTSLPIVINNTPRIIIVLPKEYKLPWYDNSKITANIDEFNSNDKNTILKTSSFSPKFILQSGNKLSLILSNDIYIFENTFQYWEITLSNIFNPPEDTSENLVSFSLGNKLFNMIFTNSDYSSVFKTHTNSNNFISKKLKNELDPWLGYRKTFSFTFDNKKWVIDIGRKDSLNKISVRAGRYVKSYFFVRENSNLYVKTNVISLIDTTFKLIQQSYSVNTSSKDPIPFLIGAPCGSQIGNYLLNFMSSDTTHFVPLSPVIVYLTNTVPGKISYLQFPLIPTAGSTLIYFKLSEPNFDQLSLEFKNDENYQNDPTSQIPSITFPAGTITEDDKVSSIFTKFSILNNQVSSQQHYKLDNPNTCFSWEINSLNINISGSLSIFPNNSNLIKNFKYNNYDTDQTLPGKNSIKITVIEPIYPSYLSCALVCIDSLFPPDDDIRKAGGLQSPLLKYYKTMIIKSTNIDFIFENLIRGQEYKLRCLIDGIEGEFNKKKSINIVMDSYTSEKNKIVAIETPPQEKSECIHYIFNNEPSDNLKSLMINYCQNLFTGNEKWEDNGCIVCTDVTKSVFPMGFSLPKSKNCSEMNPKSELDSQLKFNSKDLRLLDLDNINSQGNNFNSKLFLTNRDLSKNTTFSDRIIQVDINSEKKNFSFSVCPVPYSICKSDITITNYNNQFNKLVESFSSDENIKKNLNIDFGSISLNKSIKVLDVLKPELKISDFSSIQGNSNGLVKWTKKSSTPLYCYWQISSYTNNIDALSIKKCSDYSVCGSYRSTFFSTNITTNEKYLKPLEYYKKYGLFVVCQNDVPYANIDSDVVKIEFVVKYEKELQDDSIPNFPHHSDNFNSSKFIKLSLLTILLFILL